MQRQEERPHQCSSKQVGLHIPRHDKNDPTQPQTRAHNHTKNVRKNVYVRANL